MSNFDDDPELALALQLSKEEAEREKKTGTLGGFKFSQPSSKDDAFAGTGELSKLHHLSFSAQDFGASLLPKLLSLPSEGFPFSDIVLLVGPKGKEEKIPSHRVILCSWSDTFRVMLENKTWKESSQAELPVAVEEREIPMFKKMIQFMYTGKVEDLNSDDIVPLLALSNYYGVLPLKDACGDILGKNLDDDNVFSLLEIVKLYSCSKLNVSCAEYLAGNFEQLMQSEKIFQLDPETFAEMIKSDDLQIRSEEDVLQTVIKYVEKQPDAKRREQLERILPSVRWAILSGEFLIDHVEDNPILQNVPIVHSILHETYRYKAYPAAPTSLRIFPRKATIMFDAESSHTSVEISADRLTASNKHTASGYWINARCFPACEGICYREFQITFTNYLMIGVETADGNSAKATQYPGQTAYGWCWYSIGQTYHNNLCVQANATFTSGDTIGLLVDSNKGKIVFYRNGKATNAKFDNITANTKLFPVITFYAPGDKATIMTSKSWPSKLPKGWDVNVKNSSKMEISDKKAKK